MSLETVGQNSTLHSNMPVMIIEKVTKEYIKQDKRIKVLDQVDFEIRQKDFIAVTGASGAGKSTLLHVLGSLDRPDRGRVLAHVEGEKYLDITHMSEGALCQFRNRSLGFIFQFHHLLPEFDALENVMMPAKIAGVSKKEAQKSAENLLELVGLKDRLTHRPHELSGGEAQRVAIARAVVLKPKLVLADEPTGNLDSNNAQIVLKIMHDLNEAQGSAMLIVTHDQVLASQMKRRLRMNFGRLVEAES